MISPTLSTKTQVRSKWRTLLLLALAELLAMGVAVPSFYQKPLPHR